MKSADIYNEIESEITELKNCVLKQAHKIEDLTDGREKDIDSICLELLSVLDVFDKADARLAELFPDNEDVNAARKRFSSLRKKLLNILENHQVREIEFPNGVATLDDCTVTDTAPDSKKENDTIVSIEKPGFRRNGKLLRRAEVIVVKN
ncbi:MAG: nucleotide exchange factor GrpE [Bacteroidales bacterium]|nr:nucleotide exchange factor GrpE [Bacteroidales bacterium]